MTIPTFSKLTHDQQRALAIRAVQDTILRLAQDGTDGAELILALSQAHVPVEIITEQTQALVRQGYLHTPDNFHFRTVRVLEVN